MTTNLEKIKADLTNLVAQCDDLAMSASYYAEPQQFREAADSAFGEGAEDFIKKLPPFCERYESWYSEALAVIGQLLPSRLADFRDQYDVPKNRKQLDPGNYRIHDMLQGLRRLDGGAGKSTGIPRLNTQISILKAAEKRFSSALFDIRQLVQADLFDSEIDAAKELLKNKYVRAAGALAGVVLERHLRQVCEDHALKLATKNPTISTLNDALKDHALVDVPQWRFIQHLGDIRNSCDHAKTTEPTTGQVNDLIVGTAKVIKTVN